MPSAAALDEAYKMCWELFVFNLSQVIKICALRNFQPESFFIQIAGFQKEAIFLTAYSPYGIKIVKFYAAIEASGLIVTKNISIVHSDR